MISFEPLVSSFVHPRTRAAIDLDRLENIDLDVSEPPNRGRTTAFIVHMVGCALVSSNNQRWLYVAHDHESRRRAQSMFTAILSYGGEAHRFTEGDGIVVVQTSDGESVFHFATLATVNKVCTGILIQDYFIDVECMALAKFNNSNPGVLAAIYSRLEICYD